MIFRFILILKILILLIFISSSPLLAEQKKQKLLKEPPKNENTTELADSEEYNHCLDLARKDPTKALSEALAWASQNGGEPASHCAALAMIGMHDFSEAAEKLEMIGLTSEKKPQIRAGLFDQAGETWILANNPIRAMNDFTIAIELFPNSADFYIDRAVLYADQGDYNAARLDLEASLKLAPKRSDALILRASTYRHLQDIDNAKLDIKSALILDPKNPEAWLENGILLFQDNNFKSARESFSKVMTLAPHSEAAEIANKNMIMIDNGETNLISHQKKHP
jgi:tetratricopeptide (TPR) repeat protein